MKMKSILSIIAVTIVFCIASATVVMDTEDSDAFDSGIFSYSTAGSNATVTGLNSSSSSSSSVIIPSTVTNSSTTYNVVAIGDDAFKNKTTITTVVIPNSVTSIGTDAFSG